MVVGVLEMVDETMAVLEHYLPDYFTGLSRQKGKPCMDERKVSIYFKGFSCCSTKGKCHSHLPSTDGGDSKIFETSLPGNNIDSAIYTNQKQKKTLLQEEYELRGLLMQRLQQQYLKIPKK